MWCLETIVMPVSFFWADLSVQKFSRHLNESKWSVKNKTDSRNVSYSVTIKVYLIRDWLKTDLKPLTSDLENIFKFKLHKLPAS